MNDTDWPAWLNRLNEAAKCCGTCFGGVLSERTASEYHRGRSDERERIVQAIEAEHRAETARLECVGDRSGLVGNWLAGINEAARIARTEGVPA